MSKNHANPGLEQAVRWALASSAVVATGVAGAQTAPSTAGAATVEEVVVTGSRIATPNAVSISPVIAVNPEVLQQAGTTRVEDLLNSLPQVFAAQGSNVSNGSNGTSEVDLRGLSPKRTLVLVNGRRLGPGDPISGGPSDLNQIPAELIERVEVLTGGASSVYGADAVAGVVNFVMKRDFEGVKFVANYGFYQHHNDNPQGVGSDLIQWNADAGTNFASAPSNANAGYTKDLAFVMGFNAPDGNGNVTAYATYRNIAAVLQDKYDYSACAMGSGFTGGSSDTGGHFYCAGSSTSVPGRFRLVSATGQNLGGSRTIDAVTGQLKPFGNAYRYNFGPLNYYQRPDERYTAGAFAHYQFNEHADVYTEVQYVNDRTLAQIAPSGAFYGTGPYKVSCGNPYFSSSMISQWCGGVADPNQDIYLLVGRRNVEGNPRVDDLEHSSWRWVLGTKGKISDAWDYDTYGSISITQLTESYKNDVSIKRTRNALDVVTDPTTGNPVCRSVLNGTDPNCVPWNIWQPQVAGNITQAALNYIGTPLIQNGEITQKVFNANVTGDLGKYGVQLPTAATGVQVNFGVEWRNVHTRTNPDLEYQLGDASGQGAPTPPIDGSITSREAFTEVRVPLADDKPFAKSLAFETGYRYSDYNLGFNTSTYKFGLEWSPVQDVRLRGSWARAVRAPNTLELFQPRFIGLGGTADLCGGPSPTLSLAQCAAQGVTAAQYGNIDKNPASQYNSYLGGDPTLKPEKATTKSFGIGFTPSFLPGFRVQVDYFDIKIEDVIQRVGSTTTQLLCSNQGLLCDRIHRDVNGTLWVSSTDAYINDPLGNIGTLQEKGWDLDVSYAFDMGRFGKLKTAVVGTYLDKYEVTPIAAIPSTAFDCAGYYGNNCTYINTPNYRWRHTARATWSTPWHGLDVSLAWRFYNSVKLDSCSTNPNLTGLGTDPVSGAPLNCQQSVAAGVISNTDVKIASRSYVDLSASIQVVDHVDFRLGINNILDKSPPVIGSTNCSGCNGNTYSQVYDTLGRYIFGTVTVQF
jgi:outer membrane receptor protein involved in Fe transport